MMIYKLTSTSSIIRVGDGVNIRIDDDAIIPADPKNADYQTYLAWVAAGNTPTPADTPNAAQLWTAYQLKAQLQLDANDKVAIRCIKNGVPYTADWLTNDRALQAIMRATMGDATQPLPPRPAAYPPGS